MLKNKTEKNMIPVSFIVFCQAGREPRKNQKKSLIHNLATFIQFLKIQIFFDQILLEISNKYVGLYDFSTKGKRILQPRNFVYILTVTFF